MWYMLDISWKNYCNHCRRRMEGMQSQHCSSGSWNDKFCSSFVQRSHHVLACLIELKTEFELQHRYSVQLRKRITVVRNIRFTSLLFQYFSVETQVQNAMRLRTPRTKSWKQQWDFTWYGGMLPQKTSKSRRSEMPFLAFSWWYFPRTYSKSKLTLTAFMFVISSSLLTVLFRNKILKALKCYLSIRHEMNINLVQVHQFKSTSAEVNSLLKASLLFGES